jgi:hypothetical protein
MPGGVGGAGASPASTRFEVAAGGNRNQSATAARNWAPPADPTGMDEDRFARLTAQSGGPNPRRPGLRQPRPTSVSAPSATLASMAFAAMWGSQEGTSSWPQTVTPVERNPGSMWGCGAMWGTAPHGGRAQRLAHRAPYDRHPQRHRARHAGLVSGRFPALYPGQPCRIVTAQPCRSRRDKGTAASAATGAVGTGRAPLLPLRGGVCPPTDRSRPRSVCSRCPPVLSCPSPVSIVQRGSKINTLWYKRSHSGCSKPCGTKPSA